MSDALRQPGSTGRAASWHRRPTVGEWIALAVLVGAVAYLVAGRPLAGAPAAPDPLANLQVEETSAGKHAVLEQGVWRSACKAAGLPDPPRLDGGDPVPVRIILEQFRRWTQSGEPETLGDLGRIYLAINEHQAALELFAALRRLEPDEPLWAYFLGVAAQARGLSDLAIAALESARTADPSYMTTHARLGRLYLEAGRLDDAEQSLETCRARSPDLSLGYVGLGRVALARDDPETAATWFLRGIQATPNDARAWRFLSQTLGVLGRVDEAAQARSRAERLPRYSVWLVFDERLQAAHVLANSQHHLENQLRLLQGTGRSEHLVSVATSLLDRRPEDHKTIAVLAEAYVKLGRLEEARAAVDRGLAIEPRSVPLLCISAQIGMLTRQYATALETLDLATAIDPEDATPHNIRGRVLFLLERYDEAIAAMRRAIELRPGASRLEIVLAHMLRQTGDLAAAAAVLEAVLEREPGNTDARRRLEAIRPQIDGG